MSLTSHALAQATQNQELIFPVVETGFLGNVGGSARFESTFVLHNASDLTVIGPITLQIYSNSGERLNSFDFAALPANTLHQVEFHFVSVAPPMVPPRISGWGRVIFPGTAKIRGENRITFIESPFANATGNAHVEGMRAGSIFQITIPDFERLGWRAAVALINPSSNMTANIKIETAAYQGCPTTLSLPPLSRISKFLDEICGRAGSRGGPVLVEILSEVPVVVGAMEVLSNGSFAVLPVKPK